MHSQRILALSLALLAACSGPQAEPTSDSNATTETTEAASSSTAMPTTGGDTESDTGASCDGPDGCYACEPGEPAQVLNHCTAAACQPFPNTSQRLPLLKSDGTLPPVP